MSTRYSSLPVTVVVPVKNEERNLPECLSRLTGFTRVVVVDSGSVDATQEIARQYGAEVVDFKWNGKFPKKRNWYLRHYRIDTPWVLFVDADEFLTSEFKFELERVLPNTHHVGFWLSYHNYFMNRYLRHGDTFTKLALFRVGCGEYEQISEDQWSKLDMEVHEHPILNGTTGRIRNPIRHQDFKGLDAYFDRHNQYARWEAKRYFAVRNESDAPWSSLTGRQKAKYRLLDTWLLGPLYFLYCYIVRLGFLDGRAGFSFALCKCMYFWQIKLKIAESADRLHASADRVSSPAE